VVRVSRNHTPASTTSTITTSGTIDRLGIRGGAWPIVYDCSNRYVVAEPANSVNASPVTI
jgi:hypothetical protein